MPKTGVQPGASRWLLVLGVVAGASVLLGAGLGAWFSKSYWGYVLGPPGVDRRILGATKLLAHSRLGFPIGEPELGEIVIEPEAPLDLSPFGYRRDGDGAWRLIPASVDPAAWRDDWVRRGVIPADGAIPPVSPERCRAIPDLIESTARLVWGGEGDGFPDPRAMIDVYELLGPDGEQLLFISLSTGQLSNDHLAYYELAYDDSASPRLIDRRHWRFDVAGMEGLEFASVASAISILLLIIAMPSAIAVLAYRTFSRGSRVARGCCPVCGYDLRADHTSGCPECGWGVGDERADERDLRRYGASGRITAALCRPPGWRTLASLAAAAALIWYGRSMPGGTPWATRLGFLLLIAASLLLAIKCIGAPVRPRWLSPLSIPRRLRRFAAATVILAAALAGALGEWPLRWRFAASRSALEGAVAQARSAGFPNRAPIGDGRPAGLYVVGGIVPTSDGRAGAVVWVGGAGGSPVMRGFCWYPEGTPTYSSVYRSRIALHGELAPGWYLWNYHR